ncbi:TPM domain-containing protein [Undibacterium umbellatum]|uniref:TPM domain-containing protein n=1 Tax=Undibacterium umbellatum TaxID=2762300 RepID=UPI003BB4ACF0
MSTLTWARLPILASIFCISLIAGAQVPVPPLTGHVTDQTLTLNAEQKSALEQTLQAFEAKKGSQIAVLLVPTVSPETIEQYALRVAEAWKLGRKKVDDGAILVIAKNDRALRIEVGYGLEGALNDATSKRIISETITPRFKQGDFYGGITAGVNQMLQVIDGEPLPLPSGNSNVSFGAIQQYAPVIFVMAVIFGGLMRTLFGRFPGAIVMGTIVGGMAWLFAGAISIALISGVIALLFTLIGGGMVGRGMGGLAGVYGRGGGSFSGGGGGFGGGGASGRW